jgi:hypothetical protein
MELICAFVLQNKPQLVEPIDFETFILKNKTLLQNDPQRELLLYPSDDVSVSIIKFLSCKVILFDIKMGYHSGERYSVGVRTLKVIRLKS